MNFSASLLSAPAPTTKLDFFGGHLSVPNFWCHASRPFSYLHTLWSPDLRVVAQVHVASRTKESPRLGSSAPSHWSVERPREASGGEGTTGSGCFLPLRSRTGRSHQLAGTSDDGREEDLRPLLPSWPPTAQ